MYVIDFDYELSGGEIANMVAICDNLEDLIFNYIIPYAVQPDTFKVYKLGEEL